MKMKQELKVFGPATLLVLLAFIVAYQFIKPAPPDHVRIASGGAQGAYYAFAQTYAAELAREGITLEVLSTAGSVENIRLLREGKADVALVQGGIPDQARSDGKLHSLGSLYYEPLWLFVRDDRQVADLRLLQGLQVAVGAPGSGTQALAVRLLKDSGIAASNTGLQELGGKDAANGLQQGRLDAAFFVASPESPLVRSLLRHPDIRLVSFRRAEAYARRYHFLTGVTLPRGVADLERDLPSHDIRLLAPTANLVVSAETHPAINGLLLQAMEKVHTEGDWFAGRGEFPQPDLLAYPLAKEAGRFYKSGPPFLQRYLPFWAASLVDRLKVMLLPLVLMLLPFFKLMPPIYNWRMGSRIYRWYDDLEELEGRLAKASPTQRNELVRELGQIEGQVRGIKVPASYGHRLYHLRQHIELVRQRIEQAP